MPMKPYGNTSAAEAKIKRIGKGAGSSKMGPAMPGLRKGNKNQAKGGK